MFKRYHERTSANKRYDNGDDEKPALACIAIIHEDDETEGGEIITPPNHVQKESRNDVKVNEEITTEQKRDVSRVLK